MVGQRYGREEQERGAVGGRHIGREAKESERDKFINSKENNKIKLGN